MGVLCLEPENVECVHSSTLCKDTLCLPSHGWEMVAPGRSSLEQGSWKQSHSPSSLALPFAKLCVKKKYFFDCKLSFCYSLYGMSSSILLFSTCLHPFFFFLSFFSPIYFYSLEANYFTILYWFLPYIDMNQPWIYMCSPSRSPLPPPSPSHPSGSSQCTSPEHLSHASNLGSFICKVLSHKHYTFELFHPLGQSYLLIFIFNIIIGILRLISTTLLLFSI